MPNNTSPLPINQALDLVKEKDKAKFDSTIELHINFDMDVKKADQQIRTTTVLPNGTGKEIKVAVFASGKVPSADLDLNDSSLDKIQKGELKPGTDFDVIVAEPRFMPKLAQVARILGPAGVMPNPKTGTVTEDVEKAVQKLKGGQIELRTEQNQPIMHTIIGKKSFETKKLEQNYNEVVSTLRSNKPQKAKPKWIKSVFVSSSMGPSYQIELEA